MANLEQVVDQLKENNKLANQNNELVSQMIADSKNEKIQEQKERIAKDEGDKKKKKGGVLSRSIRKSLGSAESKTKSLFSQFLEPFLNFLTTTIGLAAIDFLSNPANIQSFKEAMKKVVGFFKGIVDYVTSEESIFGDYGPLLAGLGLAAAAILGPIRFIKTAMGAIGKTIKAIAVGLGAAAGLRVPDFKDLDDVARRRFQELESADKRGVRSTNAQGRQVISVMDKNTGQLKDIDYYDKNGNVNPRARAAEVAREGRLNNYRMQSADFAKTQASAARPDDKPSNRRWAKLLKFIAPIGGLLVAAEGYSILSDENKSQDKKIEALGVLLSETLGGLGGAVAGGIIGTATAGPFGGLAGMALGGFGGMQLGNLAANYIITGEPIPKFERGTLPADQYTNPVDEFSTLTPQTPAFSLQSNPAPVFDDGPVITPVLSDMISRASETGNRSSLIAASNTGMMDTPQALALLSSIDRKLGSWGIGMTQQNVINNNETSYVLQRSKIETTPPNR